MYMQLKDFKKKWNLTVRYTLFSAKIKFYLKDKLVGEFKYSPSPCMYWVSLDTGDEFVKDFRKVFAYRPYI